MNPTPNSQFTTPNSQFGLAALGYFETLQIACCGGSFVAA